MSSSYSLNEATSCSSVRKNSIAMNMSTVTLKSVTTVLRVC